MPKITEHPYHWEIQPTRLERAWAWFRRTVLRKRPTYREVVKATPGLVRYWPLDDQGEKKGQHLCSPGANPTEPNTESEVRDVRP